MLNSCLIVGLSTGSLIRHELIMSWNSYGCCGGSFGVSDRSMLLMMAGMESPLNGFNLVHNSYRRHPKLQISVLLLCGLDSHISGDR